MAVKYIILAALIATAAPVSTPDPMPWTSLREIADDLVGGKVGQCDADATRDVRVAELEKLNTHYTLFFNDSRFVMARYQHDQVGPDRLWFGVVDKKELRVNHSRNWTPDEDPCEWLVK